MRASRVGSPWIDWQSTGSIQHRKEIGNAHVGQLFDYHVPEDRIVHRARFLGRSPVPRADDRIGGLAGGVNDGLDVFFVHERINGYAGG